ncbi:MAG: hypothetical protein NW224_11945 [Leptolyngbyaceae cyanobacterium bins.302]|nr:hypothetical protein [Leptolyngbyaceae cyanobacterium bins.302]
MTISHTLRAIAARYEAILKGCSRGCERPCQECLAHLPQNTNHETTSATVPTVQRREDDPQWLSQSR